jgi:hypothetical protein
MAQIATGIDKIPIGTPPAHEVVVKLCRLPGAGKLVNADNAYGVRPEAKIARLTRTHKKMIHYQHLRSSRNFLKIDFTRTTMYLYEKEHIHAYLVRG